MQLRNVCLVSSFVLFAACANPSKKEAATTSTNIAPTTQVPVVASSPAPSESKAEAPKDAMICKKGTDTRILEIESAQPKGCKLFYSRHGNRNNVASSSHAKAHCEQSRAKTGETLKSAGFECVTAQTLPAPENTAKPTPAVSPSPTATPTK